MARVALEGVRKVYDNGYVAVENATFEAANEELVVFVGPSGCGKSTLLRMIAGLESVTSGTISIGARVVNDVPSKHRDIAMVFQSYALYPHMSVYENMAFGLKLRGLARTAIDERVRRSAEMLGLEALLNQKPKHLSGGQRQRVALGRALVREPSVFLLDEPLSNLDAKLRLQTRTEIARLHRQVAATMIYVTHDQTEAMTLGDRIVVLEGGRVQQIGAPMDLYRKPANRFVAGFIGSPAMNFVEGNLQVPGSGSSVPGFEGNENIFVSDDRAIAIPVDGLPPGLSSSSRVEPHPIVLGIRPEDIEIGRGGTFVLELVEPVGNEMFVYARAGSHQIVARVSPRDLPEVGNPITLGFDRNKLHYFDAKTGLRM